MRRRARTIDVAASALAHLLPSPLARVVDRARLDAASLVDGLSGRRSPSFSTREAPIVPPVALAAIDPVYELLPGPLARRYASLARDVRTVTRELRGHRSSPVVPRPARRIITRDEPVVPRRRTLTIQSLAHETRDALAITLADPSGAPVLFTPGQFLTLHLTIDGRALRRAYSIASTPSDGGAVTIVVKQIDNGLVSRHLHRTLRVGDTLETTGPSGSFVVPAATAPRHLVLFAGGSGITPIFSILRTALEAEPGARATLVLGNRRVSDVIFHARLDALAATHGARLRIVHVLEEPAPHAHRIGRPDAATITALVGELALRERLPGEDAPLFFVCGPTAMMASVRSALREAGIDDARIREERFLSPADPAARASDLPTTPQPVTVRRRGALRTFVQQPGETILEAAHRTGTELPSSCTMGGCGACRCRAVSGEVHVDEPSCLTDAERAEGYVLTCVGRARGPVTLEVA
jgi:ferredoxin-NADP reductase